MIYIDQDREEYNNDFRSMIQAFYHNEKIVAACIAEDGKGLVDAKRERPAGRHASEQRELPRFAMVIRYEDQGISFRILEPEQADDNQKPVYHSIASDFVACDYRDKKTYKNEIHGAIYKILAAYTGRTLPWGFLTGVRPTKLATEMLESGVPEADIHSYFVDTCHTTTQKADICVEVAKKEQTLLSGIDFAEEYCLYVGIPFCPTRCLYCSFTSYPIGAYEHRVDAYLDALEKEMQFASGVYKGKRLISVYIGGGTPTSISAEQLDRLIGMLEGYFDMEHVREFTVEAGRPDSITKEKLAVLKKHGIGRISINPQTMHDKTLEVIGRAHTVGQAVDTFAMARAMGFDNINMDMIVGLPGETIREVQETLQRICDLSPDSLTVHSLAIKRAANLNAKLDEYRDMIKGSTNEMLLAVDDSARALRMQPYYLYRQKNIPGNMENIGYSTAGKECLYNILIMEEKMDILALGAGASTKKVFHSENRIERAENVKYVEDYICRIDEMIDRKKRLFGIEG